MLNTIIFFNPVFPELMNRLAFQIKNHAKEKDLTVISFLGSSTRPSLVENDFVLINKIGYFGIFKYKEGSFNREQLEKEQTDLYKGILKRINKIFKN